MFRVVPKKSAQFQGELQTLLPLMHVNISSALINNLETLNC